MAPHVGQPVPEVPLFKNADETVDLRALTQGKTAILVGVPGAFTPTCHGMHLPGYVRDYDKLVAKGVDLIVCVSINDPYVMLEWGKALDAVGKIVMLADPAGRFTAALGDDMFGARLDVFGGVPRSRRYSAIVKDGVFSAVNVEPAKGAVCSVSDVILTQL